MLYRMLDAYHAARSKAMTATDCNFFAMRPNEYLKGRQVKFVM